MVVIEVIETRGHLTAVDEKITYIKQVAEIGDVSKLATSRSWTMTFPKTPENSAALGSLGVVGSLSDAPYTKIYVNVYDNAAAIVRNGLLSVVETSDTYKIYVQDGIVDFIRDLKNDEIGKVIDLSELEHRNDVTTIISSFTKDTYRYIIADYNGAPLANETYSGKSVTNLSATSLIASVNVRWLFDKIMRHYGWTYEGDMDIDNLWMTYPNATGYEDSDLNPFLGNGINVRGLQMGGFAYPNRDSKYEQLVPFPTVTPSSTFFSRPMITQNLFVCTLTGNYKIDFSVQGRVRAMISIIQGWGSFRPSLYVNSIKVATGNLSSSSDPFEIILPLNAGDRVFVSLGLSQPIYDEGWRMVDFAEISEADISFTQLGVQDISFSKALIKYKVRDFFKELMIRNALIPITDTQLKNIRFINLDNRLDAEVIDLSEKYIRRVSETYLYNDYAQNNYIRHSYDNEGEDFYDGNVEVDNSNLEAEKTLYKGKSHAPSEDLTEFNGSVTDSYFVNRFKMFDVEIKEDTDTGDLIADYKALKNRFFFMTSETKNETLFISGQRVDSFPVANISGTTYRDVVSEKYSQIPRLINRTKIHNIELAFSTYDVETLDLDKVYYFDQEKTYYLLNDVKYTSGEVSVGEFIKIEKGI